MINHKQITSQYYLLPYSQPYWSSIKQTLLSISKSSNLEITIRSLLKLHAMTRGTNIKKFNQLLKMPHQSTLQTFSRMASFVLEHQDYYLQHPKSFPLFTRHNIFSHTFVKRDIVLMMSIICLCISTNASIINKHFKTNLSSRSDCAEIYAFYKRKIPFLMNYFNIALLEVSKNPVDPKVTIKRFKLVSLKQNDILKKQQLLTKIKVQKNNMSLDDWTQDTRIKVDFANKFIGGGTLNRGCVQEQLMFLNHTQSCISILLCEPMLDNQAIGLYGFQKYFKNIGYSTTTEFNGRQNFPYVLSEDNHLNDYIIAIDALCKQQDQYSTRAILRQINKCLAGFSIFQQEYEISTGNWGSGVFKGDVQLKFIIQWISASLVGKSLVYHPYGNNKLLDVEIIVDRLRGVVVGQIFKALIEYKTKKTVSVFEYIKQVFQEK